MLDSNNSTSDYKTLDYNYLVTTKPHSISRVVISDLHLSVNQPALAQAFLALLNDLIALPNIKEFYILGDWFDAWIGDDAYLSLSQAEKARHWITPLIEKLLELSVTNCKILIMHGNRDFLIGQSFCDTFNGVLIPEPYFMTIGEKIFRLEHGDALCIDDKAYQIFRSVLRNRLIQWVLLHRPLEKRQRLADKMRMKSQQANQNKLEYIMDVNADAVANALQDSNVLLHGHTHRPAYYLLDKHKTRYVLGDWRVYNQDSDYRSDSNKLHSYHEQVEAIIGITTTIEKPTHESVTNFDSTKNKLSAINDNESTQMPSLTNAESFSLVKYVY